MLTVAFVLSSLFFLIAATPTPLGLQSDASRSITVSLSKSSKRSILTGDDGLANIEALLQALLFTRSKYRNSFEAYQRNTGSPHPLADGLDSFLNFTKRATGTIALTEEQNGALWQGSISVGTPAQVYTVDFDTGSSDLFLPASTCTTNCKGHKLYNPSSSSTAVDRRKTFSLAYGDGSSVSGEQYTETVSLARLTATKQVIGAAKQYSTGFSPSQFPPDGLMGMAYQSISQYNSPPVVQTLIAQGQLTEPLFAFKLAQSGSELTIGGVNTALYSGTFTTVPVTTKGYWQVVMDSATANGKPSVGSVPAIVDTGTTLIIGDSQNVRKFYATISGAKDASRTIGAGYYTVPCNAIPKVQLTFANKAFPISAQSFNFGRVPGTSNDCVGGVVGTNTNFWIVGDVFLENVYSSFDLGKNQVGFATLK